MNTDLSTEEVKLRREIVKTCLEVANYSYNRTVYMSELRFALDSKGLMYNEIQYSTKVEFNFNSIHGSRIVQLNTSRSGASRVHFLSIETAEMVISFINELQVRIVYKDRYRTDPIHPCTTELLSRNGLNGGTSPVYMEYRTRTGSIYSAMHYKYQGTKALDTFYSLPRSMKEFEYTMRTGDDV